MVDVRREHRQTLGVSHELLGLLRGINSALFRHPGSVEFQGDMTVLCYASKCAISPR